MKKGKLLHPELAQMLSSAGHTDYIVLADKGYPVPRHVPRINVGIMDDTPTILEVLEAVESEFIIDRIIVTHEMEDISPSRLAALKERYPDLRIDKVSHETFKAFTKDAYGVVKTGDTCPYSNLIIVSG